MIYGKKIDKAIEQMKNDPNFKELISTNHIKTIVKLYEVLCITDKINKRTQKVLFCLPYTES